MADIEFIIPGSGIVNDTEEGFEVIIPGFGIYNEQAAAPVGGRIMSSIVASGGLVGQGGIAGQGGGLAG